MRLSGPTIAQHARDAGVTHRLLAPYVAVALASSGGWDDYDVMAGLPGAGRWRGLWAIDVDRYLDYAAENMTDPHVAALCAVDLTQRTRSFRWCPAYVNGQTYRHLDVANASIVGTPYAERQASPITVVMHRQFRTIEHHTQRRAHHGRQL